MVTVVMAPAGGPSKTRVAARHLGRNRPDSGVVYTGVFLDVMGHKRLLTAFPPEHPTLYAHHMTIWHFQDGGAVPDLPWGKTVPLKVVGHFSDGHVQAVMVEAPGAIRPKGRTPHITISTDGIGPAASRGMLPSGWAKVQGMVTIKGKIGWVGAHEQVHFEPPTERYT